MSSIQLVSEHACFGACSNITSMSRGDAGPINFRHLPRRRRPQGPVLYYLRVHLHEELRHQAHAQAVPPIGLDADRPDTIRASRALRRRGCVDFGQGAGFYVDATQAPCRSTTECTATCRRAAAARRRNLPALRMRPHLRTRWATWRADHRAQESGAIQIGVRIRPDQRSDAMFLGKKAFTELSGPDQDVGATTTPAVDVAPAVPAHIWSPGYGGPVSEDQQLLPERLTAAAAQSARSSRCACSPATITAITSFRPSWPTTCGTTRVSCAAVDFNRAMLHVRFLDEFPLRGLNGTRVANPGCPRNCERLAAHRNALDRMDLEVMQASKPRARTCSSMSPIRQPVCCANENPERRRIGTAS